MRKIGLFFLLLQLSLTSIGVGQWTDYLSYKSASKVVLAGERVYCVANAGLFYYDASDNSIQKVNVIQGLSDVGVRDVAYSAAKDVVVVAYENSNLDLIYQGQVFNLSDIKRKQITGDKSINHILIVGDVAYLSCGFGIVAVNLERREIKDTYYIGENAALLKVNAMAFDGNFLFAATEDGVYKADINSPNLQYYGNWEKQTDLPFPSASFGCAAFFDNKLIVCRDGGAGSDAMYAFNGTSWNPFLPGVSTVTDIRVSSGLLVIAQDSKVESYLPGPQLDARISTYDLAGKSVADLQAQSAVFDQNGQFWIADNRYSLIRVTASGDEQIAPEGPVRNSVLSVLANGDDLWKADGGRTIWWNNMFFSPRFELFRNGSWKTFDEQHFSEMQGFHDMVCVAADPANADHVFAGSWGGGVLEFSSGTFVARYNNHNSSLQSALPSQPNEPFVRISDLEFDSKGNLWVVNAMVDEPLSVKTASGEWESYSLPGVQSSHTPGAMTITDGDDIWVTVARNQNTIGVRKADGSATKRVSVVAYYNNGVNELFTPMSDIYAIATDRDGEVWVGTAVGVAVYHNPDAVWSSGTLYASQPGLDEGDGIYHPLLSTETVTAIAVDGANRKWFGTKNSGVFLISENGTEEIQHFTAENSPLLDNEITSIAINHQNGEVFIGTTKGLISYRGEATEGEESYDDAYVYPNPVREDYFGDIVIAGLIEDTDVKITDISGNLVYKTKSLGGQAIWDGKNLRGSRVSTGVYLVFGNDRFGEQSFVAKILFIH